jgi:hypothetical protein
MDRKYHVVAIVDPETFRRKFGHDPRTLKSYYTLDEIVRIGGVEYLEIP